MIEEQTVHSAEVDEKQFEHIQPVVQETPVEPKYAGFWIRLAATLLDGIVIFAFNVLIYAMLGVDFLEPPLALELFLMLLSYVYAVVMTVQMGQTLGKMAVGIKVVREDGTSNRWGHIILRETIGKILSALILCVGYLLAAFDRRKQSLHDRIARTLVVKAD